MLAFYILREGRPESLYMKWIVFNLKRVNFTLFKKVKVKWSRYRPGVAQKVGRGIALLFHDRGTRRGERSAARPGRTLPPGKTRYPLYRRLGGPQGRSGRAENLVPTGIRSRTVQSVAQSLYRLSYSAHNFTVLQVPQHKASSTIRKTRKPRIVFGRLTERQALYFQVSGWIENFVGSPGT